MNKYQDFLQLLIIFKEMFTNILKAIMETTNFIDKYLAIFGWLKYVLYKQHPIVNKTDTIVQ